MAKKGELTLNVIVMATLALLVLLVMTFIFLRGAGTSSDGILSCASKGGDCLSKVDGKCPTGQNYIATSWTCPDNSDDTKVCCIDQEEAFGFS